MTSVTEFTRAELIDIKGAIVFRMGRMPGSQSNDFWRAQTAIIGKINAVLLGRGNDPIETSDPTPETSDPRPPKPGYAVGDRVRMIDSGPIGTVTHTTNHNLVVVSFDDPRRTAYVDIGNLEPYTDSRKRLSDMFRRRASDHPTPDAIDARDRLQASIARHNETIAKVYTTPSILSTPDDPNVGRIAPEYLRDTFARLTNSYPVAQEPNTLPAPFDFITESSDDADE